MNTIDEFIQAEFNKLVPYKPLTVPELVAIKLSFIRWIEAKKEQEQITYEFLQVKAKDDVIHRSMYLMSGSQLDLFNKLITELSSFDHKEQTEVK